MTSTAPSSTLCHAGPEGLFSADVELADPRREDGAVMCWTVRGCAGLWGVAGAPMQDDCPHNVPDRYSPCPSTCAFTRCQRPWHRDATGLDLLDPNVDRMQAGKEECRRCLYFIEHGPRAVAAPSAKAGASC